MSGTPTVFSVAALDALLEGAAGQDGDASIFTVAREVQGRVTRVDVDHISFFVHASDGADARRIVLPHAATVEELEANRSLAETSLQRAHQMALLADRMPLRLNPGWSPYRHNSLAAFFAVPRWMGALRGC